MTAADLRALRAALEAWVASGEGPKGGAVYVPPDPGGRFRALLCMHASDLLDLAEACVAEVEAEQKEVESRGWKPAHLHAAALLDKAAATVEAQGRRLALARRIAGGGG